jgi:hypothetical protein
MKSTDLRLAIPVPNYTTPPLQSVPSKWTAAIVPSSKSFFRDQLRLVCQFDGGKHKFVFDEIKGVISYFGIFF